MNLMFWKRKTGAAEDAENVRGYLAVNTEPGRAARMKLLLTVLTGYFRKTPEFRAEEDLARDAPDTEEGEEVADQAGESPVPEAPARHGLLMRISAGFTAFAREFKAPAAPATDADQEADSRSDSKAAPSDEHPEEEEGAEPAHSRKRLVIGGAAGLLVLLLAGIGIAIWPVFEPEQIRKGTRHDSTSLSSRPIDSESVPEKSQAEVETLKKENAELQARIEALKKGPPQQQPYVPPAWQAGGGTAPFSSVSGEMTLVNTDPKAAAMSLKEAVEAMNASSGEQGRKPAK